MSSVTWWTMTMRDVAGIHEGVEVYWLTPDELAREFSWWPKGVPLPVKAWRNATWTVTRYMLGTEVR